MKLLSRLDRLPFSLSRCSLTALWLSQNQSQPVITLQRDVDPVTQEQYLTCYLLPQDQLDSRVETGKVKLLFQCHLLDIFEFCFTVCSTLQYHVIWVHFPSDR